MSGGARRPRTLVWFRGKDLRVADRLRLPGYVADAEGKFDWSAPDEEVHRFINDLERPIGTYLYGRRMYEVMSAWETLPFSVWPLPDTTPHVGLWPKTPL